MKFLFAVAVIGSLVGLLQGKTILSFTDILSFSEAKSTMQSIFPFDYIIGMQAAIGGSKFCFPYCLKDNNAYQLPAIRTVSNKMYPDANVLDTDDILQIVAKVITRDMIKAYIGGNAYPDEQKILVEAVYLEFVLIPYETDGLDWAASFAKLAKDALSGVHDIKRVGEVLEYITEEFQITIDVQNVEWKKVRIQFIQEVLQEGKWDTFYSFVKTEISNLDDATDGFNTCPAQVDFSEIVYVAVDMATRNLGNQNMLRFIWPMVNNLLKDLRNLCNAAESPDNNSAAPVVNTDFGNSGNALQALLGQIRMK